MAYDFNDAESNGFDLIPGGTVAPLQMKVRPGKVGDGGWLSTSDTSEYNWIDAEFTITGGPYKGRKFWQLMMVEGPSETAVNITRSTLRGILESARKIDPTDMSDDAKKKRVVDGYGDFSGMEFVGKIGVEKAKPGSGYDDKNKLEAAVPVTSKAYASAGKASNDAPPAEKQKTAASGGSVPAWAQ